MLLLSYVMPPKFDFSGVKLRKVETQESSGAAQKNDISVYAEIYEECDGDFDLILSKRELFVNLFITCIFLILKFDLLVSDFLLQEFFSPDVLLSMLYRASSISQ